MAMDSESPEEESRRKRVKVSGDQPTPGAPSATAAQATPHDEQTSSKETEVGITNFVSTDVPGFSGLVKKRYTDFQVNEILPSGTVLHLENLSAPSSLKANALSEKRTDDEQDSKPQAAATQVEQDQNGQVSQNVGDEAAEFTISDDDRNLLTEHLGADVLEQVIDLHRRALSPGKSKPKELGKVKSDPITDKDARTQLHHATRRIFASRLETATEDDGGIMFSLASQRRGGGAGRNSREGRQGKVGWTELGGEYLHFTIYKENKDTMEVISFLARQMRLSQKNFQFAGTKDRRGVTVQRASVYRVSVERLIAAGRALRNATLGDFEYKARGLELGDLLGNEFVITLRECEFADEEAMQGLEGPEKISKVSETVSKSLHDLYEKGYFNYYGTQRFGTFATRTDTVGVKMLQGDFRGACAAILHVSPATLAAAQNANADPSVRVSSEDKARATAIHTFQTTGKINEALDTMPRKFSAETALIKHLGREKSDYLGALQSIPRNLRLMYVHAYQSLVFNFAVGERWRLYGHKVVAGDLVLANGSKAAGGGDSSVAEQVDADGDAIVLPDAGDSAASADDVVLRARALSTDEAASGAHSVFDVVLPLPGFDVIYPANEMTDFYKRFMGSDQGGELDPFDMRRKWKDASLTGGYRKILSRPGPDVSFEVKTYTEDDEQFVVTDLDKLKNGSGENDASDTASKPEAGPEKLAVVVKFQLGASQYATIALRELMKHGVRMYQPDFGGRS